MDLITATLMAPKGKAILVVNQRTLDDYILLETGGVPLKASENFRVNGFSVRVDNSLAYGEARYE